MVGPFQVSDEKAEVIDTIYPLAGVLQLLQALIYRRCHHEGHGA
jgi:hypothetical protein